MTADLLVLPTPETADSHRPAPTRRDLADAALVLLGTVHQQSERLERWKLQRGRMALRLLAMRLKVQLASGLLRASAARSQAMQREITALQATLAHERVTRAELRDQVERLQDERDSACARASAAERELRDMRRPAHG